MDMERLSFHLEVYSSLIELDLLSKRVEIQDLTSINYSLIAVNLERGGRDRKWGELLQGVPPRTIPGVLGRLLYVLIVRTGF